MPINCDPRRRRSPARPGLLSSIPRHHHLHLHPRDNYIQIKTNFIHFIFFISLLRLQSLTTTRSRHPSPRYRHTYLASGGTSVEERNSSKDASDADACNKLWMVPGLWPTKTICKLSFTPLKYQRIRRRRRRADENKSPHLDKLKRKRGIS